MRRLRAAVIAEAEPLAAAWARAIVEPAFAASAANLAHFLALRRRDVTALQGELSALGLSSLGRCSQRVRANLDATLASLEALSGVAPTCALPARDAHHVGEQLAAERTERLFGPDPGGPATRIMVTLDEEGVADVDRYAELVAAGADVARLNAAHGNPRVWGAHLDAWRAAAARLERSTVVQFDLAGPKCRVVAVDGGRSKRLSQGQRFVLHDGASAMPTAWTMTMRASAVPAFPELLMGVSPGHTLFYDDGKLSAVALERIGRAVLFEVLGARADGVRLKPDKGLNFPEVELCLPILGDRDGAALDFAAAHADVIGLSFVQRPEDVVELQRRLALRLGARPLPGVVLKVETRLAVRNLPRLIVQAGARQPVGVMIARGDLALEVGFDHLALVQAELIELCRAAHVPVVWATQVFEGLVKDGWPTRAEMSDATLAQAAQCVMLNKGPHQVAAVRMLDDILRQLDRHCFAGAPRLPVLDAWDFPQEIVVPDGAGPAA